MDTLASSATKTSSHRRVFWPLWLGMLISTASLYLLLIAISARSYEIWGSGLLAGLVFASQWMLPIVLAPLVTHICSTSSPRKNLIVSELASGLIAIVITWSAFEFPYVTFVLLVLRGFCDAVAKTARPIAIKHSISDAPSVKRAIAWLNTSFLAGTGVGALIGRSTAHRSIPEIALYAAGGFGVAALVYCFVTKVSIAPQSKTRWSLHLMTRGWVTWGQGFSAIREHGLLSHFIVLMASVGIFQAYHNVARTTIPIEILSGSTADVASFQLVTSIGLVMGAALCAFGIVRHRSFSDIVWLLATAAFAIAAATVPSIDSGLVAYFFFSLAFEVAYVLSQSHLIAACPTAAVGIVAPFQHTFSLALMVTGVFTFGKINDHSGILVAAYVAAALALVCSVLVGTARTKAVQRSAECETVTKVN